MTRFRVSPNAIPTDIMVEYYKQRVSKSGLLITEATFISRHAGGYAHEMGGIIFVQLWHLDRTGFSKNNPNNEQVVSTSVVPVYGKGIFGNTFEAPYALYIHEIKDVVKMYRQSALNAVEAGFDSAEIHSTNGYLLDSF